MSMKPKRPCGHAGCREITDNRYCEAHEDLAKQQKRDRNKRYDKHQRDQQSDRFYHSVQWDRVRQEVLIRDRGLCQHCLLDKLITMADMVHHRFPIKTHWHIRLLMSNLISLCNSCHAKIDHSKLGG